MTNPNPDLDALEREALDAWGVPQRPSDNFVEHVMAAESLVTECAVLEDSAPEHERRRSRWALPTAGVAMVAAIGVAAFVVHHRIASDEQRTQATARPPAASHAPELPPAVADDIERYVASYGQHWGPTFKFHGFIAIAHESEVVFSRGYGATAPPTLEDDRPRPDQHTIDTRFRLGFMSEQFTAAAVLQLRERGLVDLDAPLAKYLPEFAHGQSITVWQLLSHTSGLPNYTDLPEFHDWKSAPTSTTDAVARIGALELEFPPGSDFNRSSSGYFLLGAIIERVSGQPYGRYMANHVFAPASMHATTVGDAFDTGAQAYGQVWTDDERLGLPDPIDLSVVASAGGIVSTAGDLMGWMGALQRGRVVGEDISARLFRPNAWGYGLGWAIGRNRDAFTFGVIDGYQSAMAQLADEGMTIVVLSNSEVLMAATIVQDIAAIVRGFDPPRRVEHREIDVAPRTYAKYVGTYQLTEQTRQRFQGHVAPEALAQLHTLNVVEERERLTLDVPDHGRTWMHPMGRNRFFCKDHAGTTLTFELNDHGHAGKLVLERLGSEPLELHRVGP